MLITQRENLCLILITIKTEPQNTRSRLRVRGLSLSLAHACRYFQESFPHFLSPNARFGDFSCASHER
jgi:hypothetical protein